MPTFPTADTPAASTHRQHDPAARQHIAEVVDAAYAAAGLPRPQKASDDDSNMHGAVGYGYGMYAARVTAADGLPGALYQRYDNTRELLEPPPKRPRALGGH
jgi:hypothetical protein